MKRKQSVDGLSGWRARHSWKAASLSATVAGLAVLGAGLSWSGTPPKTGAQIALHGIVGQGVRACSSCHGMRGEGVRVQNAPRLAGLDPGYMDRQLLAFREGARRSQRMGPIARALNDDQREAVERYYASLPAAAEGGAGDAKLVALGRSLSEQGDWSERVPACVSCHGVGGLGVGSFSPPIAGQRADYLKRQLTRFRDGDRKDDPLGLMRGIAQRLSKSEIEAVAAFYATQPAAPIRPGGPGSSPHAGGKS